jgi:uncharacterized protein (TIGR00730 family)
MAHGELSPGLDTDPLRRIAVFCGASAGRSPVHRATAGALGRLLAESGLGLVYGGASTGLMGAIADGALAKGGTVIGVIPRGLIRYEVAHTGLTHLHIVETMHERKARMAELADAFVALPGGFGTADELFEALTWGQLGIHRKPCALLDPDGFYQPLLAFLRHAAHEGFIRRQYVDSIIVCERPEVVLRRLAEYRALPHLFQLPGRPEASDRGSVRSRQPNSLSRPAQPD